MRWLGVLTLFLVGGSLLAQNAPQVFAKDARLKLPITMRAKIVSLSDFTAQLQALTKVHCSTATAIADRKITAIFHDKSAVEVMAAVQDALFMEWKKVGDGYRLSLPPRTERDEQALIQMENEALRSALLEGLKRYAAKPDVAQDEIDRRLKDLFAKISILRKDTSPEASQKLGALREEVQDLNSVSLSYLCKALAGDLPGAVENLITGKTLCATTEPIDSVPKLPGGFMDHVLAKFPNTKAAFVMMRYSGAVGRIDGRNVYASDPRGGNTSTFFTFKPLVGQTNVSSSKLLARLAAWTSQADSSVLDKPVRTEGPTEPSPGYLNHRIDQFTLAEHLEYLADRADVPVIGDAFRTYCSVAQFRPETTVRAYVEGLKAARYPLGGFGTNVLGYFSTQRGWLFVRHQAYWQRLGQEVPESVLKPMELAARTKDFPSTTDYAEFASSLTSSQLADMRDDPTRMAIRFDAFPMQQTSGDLKLWSTLNTEQIAAIQGNGLKLSSFSTLQVRLLREDWADKMWLGKLPSPLWPVFFSPVGTFDTNAFLKYNRMDYQTSESLGDTGPKQTSGTQFHREQVQFDYHFTSGAQLRDVYVIEKRHL